MTAAANNQINHSEAAEIDKQIISVGTLLGDSNLCIPQYQRPYKWTGKHVNQLFADIALHKSKADSSPSGHQFSYRLGTIVFHKKDGRKISLMVNKEPSACY